MNILAILIPVSLILGGVGLLAFFWSLRHNQFDDPKGQANRILSDRYDDHPAEDIERMIYRVSMPASIEAFVQRRLPAAARLEFCHNERHVLIRRGGPPLAEGCEPGAQDELISLE